MGRFDALPDQKPRAQRCIECITDLKMLEISLDIHLFTGLGQAGRSRLADRLAFKIPFPFDWVFEKPKTGRDQLPVERRIRIFSKLIEVEFSP